MMATHNNTYFLPVTIVLLSVFFFMSHHIDAQEWELRKDKNGVRVYTREPYANHIKEYKATILVKTSMKTVLDIITDGNNLWKWNHKTEKSKTIKAISKDEFVFWMKNDLPWPIKDREIISRVKINREKNGSITINITPEETYTIPIDDDSIQLKKFEGYWSLVPQGEYVEITQQLYGDPEGNLPTWLLNAVITTVPYRTFLNLKKLLEN